MKKRITVGILALVLLFAFPVSEARAVNKYGDYGYEVLSDGTIEITEYYFPTYDVDYLVIPETIEGYTVTSIGIYAFEYCDATAVVIPDTVTTIKRYAFFNCSMKSVRLPADLKVIEEYAFYGDGFLERVEFPDGLLEIGEQAFLGCEDMDTIIAPSSLQSVGWYAFRGCKALDKVYYKGTKAQWDDFVFFKSNVASQAEVHYDFDLQAGDVNGDGKKNMRDALGLYALASGRMNMEPVYLMLADVNRDAQVNIRDSLLLYQSVSCTVL